MPLIAIGAQKCSHFLQTNTFSCALQDFTLELYFVTALAYTTAHGLSRILLYKFAYNVRYRKAVEQLHEFLREKASST